MNEFKVKDIKAMDLLIDDLQSKCKCDYRDIMIASAKLLVYSDYSGHKFPKIQLYNDCKKMGYSDILNNMTDGKYDS